MKKCALLLLLPLSLPFSALAKHRPQDQVSVQIVSVDTRDFRGGGSLLVRAETTEIVFGVKAIISGQNVQLVCDEGHHQCSSLGTGKTYMGELKKDSVWITQDIPLTGKTVRDHYKIKGSW